MKKAGIWLVGAGGFALQMLGLAGLADSYLAWKEIFADILTHYVVFRDFVFSVFPFSIPDAFKDYCIVGVGFVRYHIEPFILRLRFRFGTILSSIVFITILIIFWPIFVALTFLFRGKIDRSEIETPLTYAMIGGIEYLFPGYWKSIAISFGFFICILFIFSDFAEKIF